MTHVQSAENETSRGLTRATLLAGGTVWCLGLAVLMPWVEFEASEVIFRGHRIPLVAVGATGLVLALITISHLIAGARMFTIQTVAVRLAIMATLVVGLLSMTGFWYGFSIDNTFKPYEYRAAASMALYMMAVIGLSRIILSLRPQSGDRLALRWSESSGVVWVSLSSLMITLGSAGIAGIILQGMPHMVDAFTYLMQGRMLWIGHLTLDPPVYPELFAGGRHLFVDSEQMYGKYPVGWPAILGAFDHFQLGWLANPVLAGLIAVVTYRLASKYGDEYLAKLAVLVLALSAGLYWHAATWLSHLASTLWLILFALFFQDMLGRKGIAYGALAGLMLSLAIVTRPQDALFFSLPAIVAGAWIILRGPRVWFPQLAAVALFALPGVAVYLWINQHLMGDWTVSPYGDSPVDQLSGHAKMTGGVGIDPVFWLHESWVGLTREWFAGAFTAAIPIAVGLIFGWRYLRRLWLFLACSGSLLVCYGFIKFGSRTWAGPRWYVPLIPAGAVLIAAGLYAALRRAREGGSAGLLAKSYLAGAISVALITWGLAIPLRLSELAAAPPHGTDRRIVDAVESAGLHNAVIGLEYDYYIPGTGDASYRMLRSGYWAMKVPFEESDVIYVAKTQGWIEKARKSWPDRSIYRVSEAPSPLRFELIHDGNVE